MNNKVYIHNSSKKDSLIKFIIILLIPFALYGIYKNGIALYLGNYVAVIKMLYPVFYLLISLVVSFIYSLVTKNKFISYNLLNNLLIALITIPEANIFVYLALIILVNILQKFIKINSSALYMLILIIIYYGLKDYSFLNLYEQASDFKFVFFDYLIGRGYGGVGNTLLLASGLSFILLFTKMEYKSDIPICAFITYYFLSFITFIFTGKIDPNIFLNNNLIFAFIFIAPISIYSPYTKGGCLIYGILLGALCFAFSFIDVAFGVYISIFILSFLAKYLDIFIAGK